MSGSQKLPQRVLGTLRTNLATVRPCPGLLLAVAAWTLHVRGADLSGHPIAVKDPLAARLQIAATAPDPVAALLALREIFPEDLARALRERLTRARAGILSLGIAGAIRAMA